jgi:hypothetical protein
MKETLENTLINKTFLAFYKKLLFEEESPLKLNNFNSIIELDNNFFFQFQYFIKKR